MAAPRPHLRRAPIVEAVIDVRVLARPGVVPSDFQAARHALGSEYDDGGIIRSFEGRFGLESGRQLAATGTTTDLGWMFRRGPAAQPVAIAQFRGNGFAFNKLEPYTNWESVFGEADRLWRLYVELARPTEVSRLAVRYINRMQMPNPVELSDYLEAPPPVPAPMPQVIEEFLTRVVVYDEERNASAVVTQALEAPVMSTTVSVLLDIDAFREVPMAPTDPNMRAVFEDLRALKNLIFYASVTEKTVEMFA